MGGHGQFAHGVDPSRRFLGRRPRHAQGIPQVSLRILVRQGGAIDVVHGICGVAARAGSIRDSPYACAKTILPSFTTATEALGTPDRVSTCATTLSIALRVSAGSASSPHNRTMPCSG